MSFGRRRLPGLVIAGLISLLLATTSAFADDDADDADEDEDDAEIVETIAIAPGSNPPATIGLVQDKQRRTAQQKRFFAGLADDYEKFSTRMEDDYGLSWSFSLSYRQRWVGPDDRIGSSAQTLFWPSLNWDIFADETLGAGSFQYFYYGERRSGSTVQVNLGRHTLRTRLPDAREKFSQITYTHHLPGERLSVSIGQYSIFNFDSNEYLADQQLNFVNNVFSANGSSSYPVTGLGAYAQFNLTGTLSLLAGGQQVNREDGSQRPTLGAGKNPHAWLGLIQWQPAFKGLGEGHYALTVYESPAVAEQAPAQGWSINASQGLNKHWAVFGRLNGSVDQDGGSKRSQALGVALNNPLGRAAADQLGMAYGSLQQKFPFFDETLTHRQRMLEAYWNWQVVDGLLLTPDLQVIHHPLFAPERNTAWIFSLRTTLAF